MARTGQASGGVLTSSLRSFAILDLLADTGALGTNEIARRLGATPSTVSRHLGTLVAARLVEHDESGRYRLGMHLVHLGNAVLARLDVRRSAHPHLEALVAELGETATLSVPSEPDAITIDVVAAPHAVQGVSHLGRPSIAHATAAGKVMLAFTSRRPSPPLLRFSRRTITDPEALEAELQRVLARGWADAYEEREPGLNAIAAPVRASRGELVAIVAVQGPIPRFGRTAARAALPTLLEHVAEISSELGWS